MGDHRHHGHIAAPIGPTVSAPLLFYPRTTPDPLVLEWVVGPGLVRFSWSGGVTEGRELAAHGAMPDTILGYLERGELARLSLTPGRITTVLPGEGSWQTRTTGQDALTDSAPNKQGETLATRLRRDLFTLLSTPNDKGELGWPTGTLDVPTLGGSTDAELRNAVEELLGGAAGDFAASHGGSMRLASVQDGVVRITMGGACRDCPAIGRTLLFHVDRQLRPYFPNLVRVEET